MLRTMNEKINAGRNIAEYLYAYGEHMLKISINNSTDIDIPEITLPKSDTAFVHNIQVSKNSVGNTILYFETNQNYITVYDTQSSSISLSSKDVDDLSMHLPSYIITLELLEVIKSEHIHKCVVIPMKNAYHCAFIPIENCMYCD